ncbi:MAG: hypothetical protein ABIG85_07520 [Chloroflexota bacterium]
MTAPIPPVRVEYLVAWLREHREEFTEDALRGRLLGAGHPPTVVEAAFSRLHAEAAPAAAWEAQAATGTGPGAGPASSRPPLGGSPASQPASDGSRGRDALLAFLAALAAILGIPAILVGAGAPSFAVAVAIGALLLALVGWGIARDGEHPGVATGLGVALLLAVLTPVIAVVGLFGYCLVAGGRLY